MKYFDFQKSKLVLMIAFMFSRKIPWYQLIEFSIYISKTRNLFQYFSYPKLFRWK